MSARPTRRAVLLAGAAAAITRRAAAADVPIRRILVVPSSADRSWPHWVAFEDELHHLGATDGRNIGINYILRASEMSPPALTEAIAAQLNQGAEVIIASGSEHTLAAAAAATHSIPIVMIPLDYDPLAKGYIASLAHPGGNITGVSIQTIEVTAKRLDLFKQAVPDMRRVAMLWDRNAADTYEAARTAAATLGIPIVSVEVRDTPYDYERALAEAGVGPGDGLMAMSSGVFAADREKLATLALRRRLPTMAIGGRESVDAGGLMYYGASLSGMARLAASYVDKILRGAKPADLPVQQPTTFELVVNLKTAKTLGLTIPYTLLGRADEVVE
jgi:putative ABC transport system substrate-binding protein